MNINETPELTFDIEKHIYRLNGAYVPSVTTVMRPLTADVYKDIDPDVLQAAADRGTAVHAMIEDFLNYHIVDEQADHFEYFEAFRYWHTTMKPTTIKAEHRLYHPLYKYAGTTDCICIIDGKTCLIDFKTTAVMHEHLIKVQCEAYGRALQAHGIPVKKVGAVQLCKDATYNFCLFDIGNSQAWTAFTSCLAVHNYIQINKNWGNK
jgi:hypothetical protein